jgi:hypothetical protein
VPIVGTEAVLPQLRRGPFFRKGKGATAMLNDLVHVRAYRRFRLGQWEDVCKHTRRPPNSLR